jgi:hypothetical protein
MVVFGKSTVGNSKTNDEPIIMLESLQNFEQTAARFSPTVLIGFGLAAVLFGLFLWVGGLGFRRILVGILGAVSGSICGFFIIGHNLVALVLAAIAAFIAVIFERLFITILAASLAAAFALIILACPYIEKSDAAIPINHDKVSEQGLTASVSESLKVLTVLTVNYIDKIKQACLKMPVHNWPIIAVLIVIFIPAGFCLYRLASAFCCAALGTMLIFAGMISLLLYKASSPISHICYSSSFYLAVFLAMITFGTLEQLLLCKSPKKQPMGKKQANKTQQALTETTHSWRTT